MRSLLLIFPILLFLAACDNCGCDDLTPEMETSYLPLAIGNYWEFRSTNKSVDGLVEHREVEDYVTLNDKQYYLVVTTHLSPVWSGAYKDTTYYRVADDGFVFVLRKNLGIEEKRYKLDGIDGDTWSYPFVDNYVADMKLSEKVKTIGTREVRNCKDYFFDVPQWADEEYTYTLGPGVGFLKEFSDAWGGGQELKRARINGRVIEY
jgi:hypothetical protein